MLRTYDRSWLAKDLVADLILSTLLIPQGMAYAELAGLPAITGLYTTVICVLAYAVFGPSPRLCWGQIHPWVRWSPPRFRHWRRA
jgi:MFS superfamily sulfate permease-like transporter